ncbi:glycosyltransferase family 4 protein, partial [bacterium]|nr:glycosyltransferase family 4 protein [bacterium]
ERYSQSFHLDHVPQTTILPGFHADRFTEGVAPLDLHRQLGLASDVLLFGIVARMSPEKGQEVLIEALALLDAETKSKAHFILTGDDSRERGARDLKALAQQKGVAGLITFQQRYEDIRPFIAGLDIGLITSVRSEAVCRVALEYMSFAKPIISSDVNILPEVVRNGENGWVYKNRDAQDLAQCIRDAVQESGTRTRFGKRGFEFVHSDFSIDNYIEQTLRFYSSVIHS